MTRLLAAFIASLAVVSASAIANAKPAKPKAAPTPKPDEAAPASKPDDAEAAPDAKPAPEEAPPDEKTMEGVDENPGAPREPGTTETPTVVAPPPRRLGYPMEEVLRPITLPEQSAEVSIDLRADIQPALSSVLRGRYGITRQAQIGLRYVLGTAYDPDGDTGPEGMSFKAGKAVALDGAFLIQDWVAAQVSVPIYFDPFAIGLVLGAPLKFRFGDKVALFALSDVVDIKLYEFVPSLTSEAANVANAELVDKNSITDDGRMRLSAGAIVQLQSNLALIGYAATEFPDFRSTGLVYPFEATLQYSLSNKLDVAGRVGFDDLNDGDTFGVRITANVRI